MKRTQKTYKQSWVNAIILALVLILFLYVGVQFSKNFSTKVSTQRAQQITDVEYLSLTGYVFRNESPIYGPGEGVYDYPLDEGGKVGADQTYATYYKSVKSAAEQERLDSVSEQIRRLSAKASGGSISDLAGVSESLSSSYYSFINNVLNGDSLAADRRGEELVDALVNYKSITTGWNDADSGALAALKSEKEALLASYGRGETLSADEGFYFYRTVDGYENVFSPDKLDNITFEELEALTDSRAEIYSKNVIGKRVDNVKWYLVIPTDAEIVGRFSYEIPAETESESETDSAAVNETAKSEIGYYIGKTYTFTYSSDGERTGEMFLDNAYTDENGNGYLVFTSYDLVLSSELSREQDVKIRMSAATGYRVPTESIVTVKGESGVYILVGTVVKFKRVTVVKEYDGYCIVKTYAEDRAELDALEEAGVSVEKSPYLKENDLIITSGNDLYDGKLID